MSGLQNVGERLKQAREAAGFTQHAVSLQLEVTTGTVQAWEYERAKLTLYRAAQLATLYKVTTDWLAFGGSKPDSDAPIIRELKALIERRSTDKSP
ncbi:HipB Predicted transcriptional regulators [uncultured Caudovirales phage]|uniref:HipB Predicted transcriptional regulators n=1 Tax=uncultured Caudovirales phage TaxID=2100421 RepID=A0A6J5PIL5_9CAUD|nr:HipB Predicted transcriptional regulators [uncultured Caudovirales phage]CAB4187691.1 HipB Predicted transcriptional regulators [uncultured Caudovirales phage]CAB4200272.1 HipB Predicted transcriptional regulators [uncultured Caudovirales phage]